ncbi:MAG TPA: D-2-hydroxyacid dehydrogenase family protein, partial [Candidatus Methylomirabilis sp.]|nr:D-2-hydroxyacid dehydrogenase family protein [Candidatus Methylomirabilis sp.]
SPRPIRHEAIVKRIAVLDDYQGTVLSLPYWSKLSGRARLEVFRDTLSNEDELVRRLASYEILVTIRERTRFPASLLARLPALELLALTGKNSGQADAAAATARGVLVTETEGSGVAAFEHTIGLMLATVRSIPQENRAMRHGRWQTEIGVELSGKTLGILGLGRIGGRMAAFGKFLGMRVLAWGPTLTKERAAAADVSYVTPDTLFRDSDVISLHLRLSEKTRRVVTAQLLSLMKPTAFLINTARGPLVDEAALVTALRERRMAGAGLDVFDGEPLPPSHPFLTLDNVVLTPHIGYVTQEAYHIFFRQVVESIEVYLDGKIPPRTLNPEALRLRATR